MPRKSKAYKEGMAAGAAPFEEKFNKQAEAVEKISKNINSKLDGLNGIMDVVLDEMSAQERKKIYDLNTIVDISKLDNAEKGFLCSAVFAVANQNECLTDGQKKYLLALKRHLMITDIQQGIDLSSIENIENTSTQKAIMQVLMEFLFIEYQNHDYMDDYEDIFDYFSVSRKGVREIQESIDNMYKTFGIDGIINHYALFSDAPKKEQTDSTSAASLLDSLLASAEKAYLANNMQEAFHILTVLTSQNNPRSFYLLGFIYLNGYGVVNVEHKKAMELFKKGAELGDCLCKKKLADFSKDYKEADGIYSSLFDEIYALACQGDIFAILELGKIYAYADKPLGDEEKAIYWFQEGAKLGNSSCIHNLGMVYSRNDEADKAFEMFQRGAECGYMFSLLKLGYMYYYGWGREEDYDKALELFTEAAEKGCAEAQRILGKMYDENSLIYDEDRLLEDALLSNYEIAEKWYQKAADNEDGEACFHLAVMESPTFTYMSKKTYDLLLKAKRFGYKNAEIAIAYYGCTTRIAPELVHELCPEYYGSEEEAMDSFFLPLKALCFDNSIGEHAAELLEEKYMTYLDKLVDEGNTAAMICYAALYNEKVYFKKFYDPSLANDYLRKAQEAGAVSQEITSISRNMLSWLL